jgi:hypothetical protein
VRVFIQDKKSFRYLGSESDWTNNISNARNFRRIREAAEFCRQSNLHHCYIVTGDFAEAGQFNGAIKLRLDVAQLRSSNDRSEQSPLESQMKKSKRGQELKDLVNAIIPVLKSNFQKARRNKSIGSDEQ